MSSLRINTFCRFLLAIVAEIFCAVFYFRYYLQISQPQKVWGRLFRAAAPNDLADTPPYLRMGCSPSITFGEHPYVRIYFMVKSLQKDENQSNFSASDVLALPSGSMPRTTDDLCDDVICTDNT